MAWPACCNSASSMPSSGAKRPGCGGSDFFSAGAKLHGRQRIEQLHVHAQFGLDLLRPARVHRRRGRRARSTRPSGRPTDFARRPSSGGFRPAGPARGADRRRSASFAGTPPCRRPPPSDRPRRPTDRPAAATAPAAPILSPANSDAASQGRSSSRRIFRPACSQTASICWIIAGAMAVANTVRGPSGASSMGTKSSSHCSSSSLNSRAA